MNSLLGTKVGMSRLFGDGGDSTAVSVIDVSGNRVCQVKSSGGRDGYDAVQLAHGTKKKKRVTRAVVGHLAKHSSGLAGRLVEVRCSAGEAEGLSPGDEVGLDAFQEGGMVDVTGTSKGRGFAGAIRRHNFRSGRATHGNSRAHNKPGSIGQCQDPGRVFKGKKMPGHLGAERVTVKNLRIARVDREKSVIYVAGGVPGAGNSDVVVRLSASQPSGKGQQ